MRGKIDFQEYSRVLGEGLLANNVIISLLDYQEGKDIGDNGREVLKRAKNFLDAVIDGSNLQNSVFHSVDDIKAAKAFNSVKSKGIIPKTGRFLDYISVLSRTLEQLIDGHQISDQELKQLDKFFSDYSRMHSRKVNTVLEAV